MKQQRTYQTPQAPQAQITDGAKHGRFATVPTQICESICSFLTPYEHTNQFASVCKWFRRVAHLKTSWCTRLHIKWPGLPTKITSASSTLQNVLPSVQLLSQWNWFPLEISLEESNVAHSRGYQQHTCFLMLLSDECRKAVKSLRLNMRIQDSNQTLWTTLIAQINRFRMLKMLALWSDEIKVPNMAKILNQLDLPALTYLRLQDMVMPAKFNPLTKFPKLDTLVCRTVTVEAGGSTSASTPIRLKHLVWSLNHSIGEMRAMVQRLRRCTLQAPIDTVTLEYTMTPYENAWAAQDDPNAHEPMLDLLFDHAATLKTVYYMYEPGNDDEERVLPPTLPTGELLETLFVRLRGRQALCAKSSRPTLAITTFVIGHVIVRDVIRVAYELVSAFPTLTRLVFVDCDISPSPLTAIVRPLPALGMRDHVQCAVQESPLLCDKVHFMTTSDFETSRLAHDMKLNQAISREYYDTL